jgi:hypothetical protein
LRFISAAIGKNNVRIGRLTQTLVSMPHPLVRRRLVPSKFLSQSIQLATIGSPAARKLRHQSACFDFEAGYMRRGQRFTRSSITLPTLSKRRFKLLISLLLTGENFPIDPVAGLPVGSRDGWKLPRL